MSMKKVIAAATLPAMMATPVAAANPAASLSLRGESADSAEATAAATETANAAAQPDSGYGVGNGGISPALLIGGLAVVAVIIGAVALGSGHHGSRAASY